MHPILAHLMVDMDLTGNLRADMVAFLNQHGLPETAGHCSSVGSEARRLALHFGENVAQAEIAGWFHDISAVFPTEARATIAQQLGLEVLAEEVQFPMIVHQKLSAIIAQHCFGIDDSAILSAIGCHTTLKAQPSRLDKVVFVADKIAWDQPGKPPYLVDILAGVDQSLDEATLVYLRYLWSKRAELKVVHPWFVAAYQELNSG